MCEFTIGQQIYYINRDNIVLEANLLLSCDTDMPIMSNTEQHYHISSKGEGLTWVTYFYLTELEAYEQLAICLDGRKVYVQDRINALEALKRKEAEELLAKEQKAEPRYSLIADSNNAYKLSVSEAIKLVVITGLTMVHDMPKITNVDSFSYCDYKYSYHPKYSIDQALTLAQRINAGEQWVIFTHSDYFIRTLNNLMLICDNNLDPELYGYKANQLFSSKVMLYFEADEQGKLTDFNVNGNTGIETPSIDKVIWDSVDQTKAIIDATDK